MRILVLMPHRYGTSPGARFRIEQWAKYLEPEGFVIDYEPFEDEPLHRVIYQPGRYLRKASLIGRALLRRLEVLKTVGAYDLVFLQREAAILGPAVIERLLARAGVPIVFDFDDAIWTRYRSPANRSFSYLKCCGKTATICRLAGHVIAGNPYLAQYARRHNPIVSVVPTTIDTDLYRPRPDPAGQRGPVTIGWTGSYSTVQHLETLREALTALGARAEYRFLAIGTADYRLDGVETVAKPWQAATETDDLARIDVGVMPLPDEPYAQGKCGLKLLQYMALGIPAVASPVGVNREIIEDGTNGFLAATDAEWVEKLQRLLIDGDLRRRIGVAGRRTVEERYSGHVWAAKVGGIFRSLAPTGAVT